MIVSKLVGKKAMEVIENQSYITISNTLIRACFDLSANEMRLLLVAMAKTPKYLSNDKENKLDADTHAENFNRYIDPTTPYYIAKSDFVDLGVEPSNVVQAVRSACKDLMSKQVKINTELGDYWFNWVSNAFFVKNEKFKELSKKYQTEPNYGADLKRVGRGDVVDTYEHIINSDDNIVARVVFTADTLKYIALLQEEFAHFPRKGLSFSSFYSYRIYLLMMSWKSTGSFFTKLDTFKNMLDLGNKYDRIPDLRKRVLDVAMKEINALSPYKAEYYLTDGAGRSGRGIKVTHVKIKFKIKNKETNTDKALENFSILSNTSNQDIALGIISPSKIEAVEIPFDGTKQSFPKKSVRILKRPRYITEQTWGDFLDMRKAQRKSMTVTAWKSILVEMIQVRKKTGHRIEDVLKVWVSHSWASFKEEYYLNATKKTSSISVGKQPSNTKTNQLTSHSQKNGNPNLDGLSLYTRILADDDLINKFIQGNPANFNEKILTGADKIFFQKGDFKSLMKSISYKFSQPHTLKGFDFSMVELND